MDQAKQSVEDRLNALLEKSGLGALEPATAVKFATYVELLIRWNTRMNLTAIRDEDEILARHFVESIACARAVPSGVKTLLDYGSGAGFPGMPIALCRQEIAVTLAESQGKKAAFLRELARTVAVQVTVHADRAESLAKQFDCVTLRAVDQMPSATIAGMKLVSPGGWLILMTSDNELTRLAEVQEVSVNFQTKEVPGSERGVLAIMQKPL